MIARCGSGERVGRLRVKERRRTIDYVDRGDRGEPMEHHVETVKRIAGRVRFANIPIISSIVKLPLKYRVYRLFIVYSLLHGCFFDTR